MYKKTGQKTLHVENDTATRNWYCFFVSGKQAEDIIWNEQEAQM